MVKASGFAVSKKRYNVNVKSYGEEVTDTE
jgi:hypothetical protein